MQRDCPHNQCSFFLSSTTALCPACGRRIDSFNRAWLALPVAAIVVFALILLPVRSSLIATIAMGLAAVVAVGIALRWRHDTPATTALDDRYQQACDESQYWLEKWGELFALTEPSERYDDAEQLLLEEAIAGAADAAAEAVSRRDGYARRFIGNGFDRLDHLIAASADIQQATAIIEHYLDTLWIDPQILLQARKRLAQTQPTQGRSQLLQLAGSVSMFDTRPERVGTDLDAERFRLRAERRLLRESPLSEADFL